jgi:chemotaxis protein methyltransferase CheR
MRDRFFVREDRFFQLRDEVRRRVRFFRHDILAETSYPEAQLILCRNVLIYFSRAGQDQILRRFARTLGEGGFLVLGRAETLLGETRLLYHADFPAERIYRCTREGVQGQLSGHSTS